MVQQCLFVPGVFFVLYSFTKAVVVPHFNLFVPNSESEELRFVLFSNTFKQFCSFSITFISMSDRRSCLPVHVHPLLSFCLGISAVSRSVHLDVNCSLCLGSHSSLCRQRFSSWFGPYEVIMETSLSSFLQYAFTTVDSQVSEAKFTHLCTAEEHTNSPNFVTTQLFCRKLAANW